MITVEVSPGATEILEATTRKRTVSVGVAYPVSGTVRICSESSSEKNVSVSNTPRLTLGRYSISIGTESYGVITNGNFNPLGNIKFVPEKLAFQKWSVSQPRFFSSMIVSRASQNAIVSKLRSDESSKSRFEPGLMKT